MIYKAREAQVAYGQAIRILMLDSFVPFVPGDVGNASTFSFPVRYEKVHGLTFKNLYDEQKDCLAQIIQAGIRLEEAGVKAVTADCGFMILYQRQLAEALTVPVFTSSLLQLPFIDKLFGTNDKIGVITASADKLTDSILKKAGADPDRIVAIGMEEKPNFSRAALEEIGWLDSDAIEKEAVQTAVELVEKNPAISVLLLECSILAPYAKAIQYRVNLPIFDYVSMIEFINRSVVKTAYKGFI
ncbi:aspartate/glutamate racemase family protein [Planomicrobium sp. CPCC 101079]|uniref:aspartate/glutamate racemase family protein n=1 Tax=Planomicrobium sp. CPCC 101079 TaxID=2599618 RepID=UPI0016480077|nr:aspartate/glutamate racemase family protein [Planomicrobium sp. CPCC 101079]